MCRRMVEEASVKILSTVFSVALPFHHKLATMHTKLFKNAAIFWKFGMVPRPLAPARLAPHTVLFRCENRRSD